MGGDSALGVFAIVNRLYSGLNTPQTGIVQGMEPIVGFIFGQKKFDRVRNAMALSVGVSAIYGLIICGLCLLFRAGLIGLLSKEAAIIAQGRAALIIMSLACPLGGIDLIVAAYFQ